MLTPNVHGTHTGTAHPESASKALARGHHALAAKVRESRNRRTVRFDTLYCSTRGVTSVGIDYQQMMMPVLYGPGDRNGDLN